MQARELPSRIRRSNQTAAKRAQLPPPPHCRLLLLFLLLLQFSVRHWSLTSAKGPDNFLPGKRVEGLQSQPSKNSLISEISVVGWEWAYIQRGTSWAPPGRSGRPAAAPPPPNCASASRWPANILLYKPSLQRAQNGFLPLVTNRPRRGVHRGHSKCTRSEAHWL